MILAMVAALGVGCAEKNATDVVGDLMDGSGQKVSGQSPSPDASSGVVASTGILEVRVHDKPLDGIIGNVIVTISALQVHKAAADQVQNMDQLQIQQQNGSGSQDGNQGNIPPGQEKDKPNGKGKGHANANAPDPTVSTTAGSTDAVVEGQSNGDTAGWMTVPIKNDTFDLLTLTDGLFATVAETKLQPGKYTQVRLLVSNIDLLDNDGKLIYSTIAGNMTLPSGKLKFVRPFEVIGDETTVLDFDFIVDESIHLTGNGKAMFKPVIKLKIEHEPSGNAGSNDADGGGQTWYQDNDGDLYGNMIVSQISYTQPAGYVLDNTDCNDNNPYEKPGQIWYRDNDNDLYGNMTVSMMSCMQPVGYVLDNTDCNDSNADEKPGQIWYQDNDNDLYGNMTVSLMSCTKPVGYVLNNADCNDSEIGINPGAGNCP